ncbi:MAG: hypothetical protein CUN49_11595 [Candidatus Thermofonsia Clade 1 bacterium]|jgi:hypothetical protein|uniref:ESAT-6 protein secretion system EspG family protein n=1 Tax=Candidatus Thermofonsia Clade 1 bacterium TaxID=2364210 RepID=A0A2M8PCF7_9CHLR|nr:MAG: hypothetical protein CUN49_11595 [Candidatus Thermofonsia Clade 1 bacterium]PJF42828.1 MAG: hypothetical protein CUN50_02765 [Candidatus Thermofonsia Clade 1 bacterium]RMF52033.1 MAG: hypothetical protein D6749_06105 [Chloroflexota bacterium]
MTNPTDSTPERVPAILVDLSDYEVIAILRQLGAQRLPGFEPTVTLDENVDAAIQSVLLARGLATITAEGTVAVEDGILAMVGAGTLFGAALSLTAVDEQNRSEQHWFYIAPGVTVYHSTILPRVQRFQTVPDSLSMTVMLAQLMRIDPNSTAKVDSQGISMPLSLWERIAELNRAGQQAELAQELTEIGVPAEIVAAVTQPSRRMAVSMIYPQPDGSVQSDSLIVLNEASGFWLARIVDETVEMTPANSREVLDALADLITLRARAA